MVRGVDYWELIQPLAFKYQTIDSMAVLRTFDSRAAPQVCELGPGPKSAYCKNIKIEHRL